jgi:hypothetical protein
MKSHANRGQYEGLRSHVSLASYSPTFNCCRTPQVSICFEQLHSEVKARGLQEAICDWKLETGNCALELVKVIRSRLRSDFSCLQSAFAPESDSGYSTATDYGEFWIYRGRKHYVAVASSYLSHESVVPRTSYTVWSMEYGVWRRDTLHRIRLKMMNGQEVT